MGRHRFVLAISITFTSVALTLWGLSLDDGSQVSRIVIAGAQVSAAIAALLWVALWTVRSRERAEQRRADADAAMNALIRTLSDAVPALPRQRVPATTLPLRRPPWRE